MDVSILFNIAEVVILLFIYFSFKNHLKESGKSKNDLRRIFRIINGPSLEDLLKVCSTSVFNVPERERIFFELATESEYAKKHSEIGRTILSSIFVPDSFQDVQFSDGEYVITNKNPIAYHTLLSEKTLLFKCFIQMGKDGNFRYYEMAFAYDPEKRIGTMTMKKDQ